MKCNCLDRFSRRTGTRAKPSHSMRPLISSQNRAFSVAFAISCGIHDLWNSMVKCSKQDSRRRASNRNIRIFSWNVRWLKWHPDFLRPQYLCKEGFVLSMMQCLWIYSTVRTCHEILKAKATLKVRFREENREGLALVPVRLLSITLHNAL